MNILNSRLILKLIVPKFFILRINWKTGVVAALA